jgi:hypothetical protein
VIEDLKLHFQMDQKASVKINYTLGNDFFSRTQLVQQLRERINKWDYTKLKSLCTAKEMIYKLKRLPTIWEKIFAIRQGIDNQNIQGAQKTELLKNQ